MNNQNSKCYDCNHEKIFHNERGSACGFSLCDCMKYFPHPTTSKSEEHTCSEKDCTGNPCKLWTHKTSFGEMKTYRETASAPVTRLENWEEESLFETRLAIFIDFVEKEANRIDEERRGAHRKDGGRKMQSILFLKSFISTLLQEERERIMELAKECYEDVGDGGDPYVAQRNVGVAMVIGKIQQQ